MYWGVPQNVWLSFTSSTFLVFLVLAITEADLVHLDLGILSSSSRPLQVGGLEHEHLLVGLGGEISTFGSASLSLS